MGDAETERRVVKILVGHIATTPAWNRFIMSQRWQDLIGPIRQFDRIVVTDKAENQLPYVRTVVTERAETNGFFNLSALRNTVRLEAQRGGYDGFIILESDFLVLRWPTVFPATWAVPYAVYIYKEDISFVDLPDNLEEIQRDPMDWENLGGRRYMIPVHCVLVNSRLFDIALWDERFEGCGYDDWDFNNHMHNNGYPQRVH